jgi:hypothetical protein
MWGRRIDFNERNNNVINDTSNKVHKVQDVDSEIAYSNTFKKPLLNFTNYFTNLLIMLKKSDDEAHENIELNSSLTTEHNSSGGISVSIETNELKPKQKAIRTTWFYLNLFGLFVFIILVFYVVIYSYQNYNEYQDTSVGILGT